MSVILAELSNALRAADKARAAAALALKRGKVSLLKRMCRSCAGGMAELAARLIRLAMNSSWTTPASSAETTSVFPEVTRASNGLPSTIACVVPRLQATMIVCERPPARGGRPANPCWCCTHRVRDSYPLPGALENPGQRADLRAVLHRASGSRWASPKSSNLTWLRGASP